MRLMIAAVGRLRAGPELSLIEEYLDRADKAGRPLALGPCEVIEIDERKARDKTSQSRKLIEAVRGGAVRVALDERGKTMTSPAFASLLARERDGGTPAMAFLIVGDMLAAIVGKAVGRTRVFGKSLEGFAAGFGGGFLAAWALVPGLGAGPLALAAFAAAVVEILPIPVDDNFRIPLLSGLVLELLVTGGA